MASPLPSQSATQPLTPPAEPPAAQNTTTPAATNGQQAASSHTVTPGSSQGNPNPAVPLTSLDDKGTSKRPRDARLIHLILASMGVSAYQERVPLQLLDFAFRYTHGVLSDAVHIQSEGYDTAETGTGGKGRGKAAAGAAANAKDSENAADPGGISLTALRMAIAGRTQYQYSQGLPKEFLVELATKRNAIGLPGSMRGGTRISDKNDGVSIGGVRLPHEKYCISGIGWGLREAWDSEGEEDVEPNINGTARIGGDVGMGGTDDKDEDLDMEDAAEKEALEDLFGGGGGAEGDGDQDHEMGEG